MQACVSVCACVCFLTEMRKSEVRKRNVISKKVNKLLDIMSHVHTHIRRHIQTPRHCALMHMFNICICIGTRRAQFRLSLSRSLRLARSLIGAWTTCENCVDFCESKQ